MRELSPEQVEMLDDEDLGDLPEEQARGLWMIEIPVPDGSGEFYKLFVPADAMGDQCRAAIREIEAARSTALTQFEAIGLNDPAARRRIEDGFVRKALDTHAIFRYVAQKAQGEGPVMH